MRDRLFGYNPCITRESVTMLFKILLLCIAFWLVLSLLKQYRRSVDTPTPRSPEEAMVQCATCAVHLPKSESLEQDGRFYCCEAHRPRTDA